MLFRSWMKIKTDFKLGTRLWRTATTGSEDSAELYWFAYVRRRVLIFLCALVVSTFVFDTSIDNSFRNSNDSVAHKVGSILSSLVLGLIVAQIVLLLDTARLRSTVVSDLVKKGARSDLHKKFPSLDVPRIVF